MKFYKNNKLQIYAFILFFTAATSILVGKFAPAYIRIYFIIRYLSLFLFQGLLAFIVLEYLYKKFKIYFEGKQFKLWPLQILSLLILIGTLFQITTRNISTANESMLIEAGCQSYDQYDNLIYDSILDYSCPVFTTEKISESHIKLHGTEQFEDDRDIFEKSLGHPNYLYNSNSNVNVLTDIDISYYPDGMIENYSIKISVFYEVENSETYLSSYVSYYKTVENIEQDDGFISTRTLYNDSQDFTESVNRISYAHPESYNGVSSVSTLEVTRESYVFEQEEHYSLTVILDEEEEIVASEVNYSYMFERDTDFGETELTIYSKVKENYNDVNLKENVLVYYSENLKAYNSLYGTYGNYKLLEEVYTYDIDGPTYKEYAIRESAGKVFLNAIVDGEKTSIIYCITETEYGYRLSKLFEPSYLERQWFVRIDEIIANNMDIKLRMLDYEDEMFESKYGNIIVLEFNPIKELIKTN